MSIPTLRDVVEDGDIFVVYPKRAANWLKTQNLDAPLSRSHCAYLAQFIDWENAGNKYLDRERYSRIDGLCEDVRKRADEEEAHCAKYYEEEKKKFDKRMDDAYADSERKINRMIRDTHQRAADMFMDLIEASGK